MTPLLTRRPRYRPRFHYAPATNWMNDPNGLVYVDGTFHLYYQYNPHGDTHASMHWGKATSVDLVRWEEHGIALPQGNHEIFSGSAVVDWHNTSGFGKGAQVPLVACYTGHTPGHQAQFLAYSLDGGEHWTAQTTPVLDVGKQDFRDPKIFWHAASESWIMAVVHPVDCEVELLRSLNLRDWSPLSVFRSDETEGVIWEVPELFPIQDDAGQTWWLLKVDINPGGPFGGSGVKYWLGEFDGQRFTPRTPARWVDHGKDFYAALSWNNLPGRRVWIGWMNNWQYARSTPSEGQRGMMSLPRELALATDTGGPTLTQRPVPEVQALRGSPVRLAVDQSIRLTAGGGCELNLDWHWNPGGQVCLRFLSDAGVEATLTLTEEGVSFERPATPVTTALEGYAGTHQARLRSTAAQNVQVFLDACSVEIFVDSGRVVISDLLFAAQPVSEISLDVSGLAEEIQQACWELPG